MKKWLALALAVLLCLSMVACGNNNDEQLAEMQKQIDALKGQQETGETQAASVAEEYVYAFNATIEGAESVAISEETELEAKAEAAEGMVVDHWTVNGQAQENSAGETFRFSADSTAVVEPVFRAEKKVTAINAEMRFVDADRKPAGDAFTEFVFEDAYTNTATNDKVSDGTINVEVKAVIPAGKVVDYWLINGVKYHYGTGVTSFVVEQLDEATTYEVVLKDKPITYYKLTCYECSWGGKKSASVAAGSTITIRSSYGTARGKFYVNGVLVADNYDGYITITITSDTNVEFYLTVN